MTIVSPPYSVSNSGCIIDGNIYQRLISCEISMGRKSRRRSFKIRAFVVIALMLSASLFLQYNIPIVNWFKQNLHTIITIVLLSAALATTGTLVWLSRQKIVSRGSGDGTWNVKWTFPPLNMKDELAFKVWHSIEVFKPSRYYELESGYHNELFNWLNKDFSQAEWESPTSRRASRPDISIGNIAIEVKGPTGNRELDTITHKAIRYRNHYDIVLFVLFSPHFTNEHFDDIKKGMKRDCRYAGVITKT